MSPEADRPAAVDLDKLLSDLRAEAEKTKELADRLGSQADQWEGSSEQLITDIAENLSTLRASAGLPAKDADHFRAEIKARQHG